MIILTYLKRLISSSEFFWKVRHLYPKDKFNSKYINYVPQIYFDKIFKNRKINSILDFGCATGEKMVYFSKRHDTKYTWGVDINKQALNIAKKKLLNNKNIIYFNCSLKVVERDIKNFLFFSQLNKIDLIFFSRVLYILPDHKVKKILNLSIKYFNYIYIDDFFHDSKNIFRVNEFNYKHTNFDYLLKKKFKCVRSDLSPHRKKVLYATSLSKLYKRKSD